jgi:hypothetical protein
MPSLDDFAGLAAFRNWPITTADGAMTERDAKPQLTTSAVATFEPALTPPVSHSHHHRTSFMFFMPIAC